MKVAILLLVDKAMNRGTTFAVGVFWCVMTLTTFTGAAFAESRTPAQLEAEFDREPSPKKRLKLAAELTDQRLKQMLAAFGDDDPAKGPQVVKEYLSDMERFEKALQESSSIGKNIEIRLRRQLQAVENLRLSVSYAERSSVDEAAKRVTQLHEAVLDRIMNPHNK